MDLSLAGRPGVELSPDADKHAGDDGGKPLPLSSISLTDATSPEVAVRFRRFSVFRRSSLLLPAVCSLNSSWTEDLLCFLLNVRFLVTGVASSSIPPVLTPRRPVVVLVPLVTWDEVGVRQSPDFNNEST